FRALAQVDPGFAAPGQVQTFRVGIPDADIKDPEKVARAEEAILRKIEALPGVQSVGIASSIPMEGNRWSDPIFAEDRTYQPGDLPPLRRFRFISPAALATLGIPLVAGRDLTWTDLYAQRPVAIVSEILAREYWGGAANALGKHIRVGATEDWREIVGITGNVYDDGTNQEP